MTDSSRRNLLLAGAGVGAGLVAPRSFAQSGPYPNRQVKIVVGAQTGGLSDAYARLFAEQFTNRFNVP
jgi:tripartite-type tricarboxylate transporter receptor subunit TctC